MQALTQRFRQGGGLLILVAAALTVIALLGLLDRLTGELSAVQGVALGLAVLIVTGRWVRRRTVRILPFANLVAGEPKARLDPVAAGLADELDIELRRIGRLSAGSAFAVVRDLYSQGLERTQKPPLQPVAGKLGSGSCGRASPRPAPTAAARLASWGR